MAPVATPHPPSEPMAAKLGPVLRRLRRSRGLAQRDLLQPLHLGSHSAIVEYEAGRRIPGENVIEGYERFFNLAPGTLGRLRDQALAERADSDEESAGEAGEAQSASESREVAVRSADDASGDASGPAPLIPRQLPPATEHFTGRLGELVRLDRLLRESDTAMPVVISAVNGMGGIGKTTLAVYWAHQARDSFPDGELYVDLQGFHPSGRPVTADDALGRFLTVLGVPEERMPTALDGRVALYRTLMAERAMLVLLDNARDADHIRPLLPAAPRCRVLITSRSRLSGLAVHEGVQRISLETLALRDAIRLLRRTIGQRAAAEPGATAALAELCARHPLSLRIVAERIGGDDDTTVTDAVAQLSVDANRLSALAVEDDDSAAIRAVFGWSYKTLAPPARRLFRLLGLHDGPDITLGACSALADLAEKDCAPLLARLIELHLAEEPRPGRYRVHDLLRLFARERAVEEVPEDERTAAIARLVGWYLHSACAARVALDPHLPPLEPPAATFAAAAAGFDDKSPALGWYDVERPNLVAAAFLAHAHGLNVHGWQLPIALFPFFDRRKFFEDWVATHKTGAECARLAGDAEAEGKVLCNLGSAYRPLRRFAEAVECYERVGELFRSTGWRLGEGKVLGNLAAMYTDAGQFPEAVSSGLAALDVFRELDDDWGQALCLSNLGNVYAQLDEFDEAMRMQAESLELFRRLEDPRGAGRAVNGLGTALARLGQPEQALPHLKESVEIFAEVGDHHEHANALVGLAEAYTALGRPAQAAQCLRAAGDLFTMLGEHWMVAELRPLLEAAEAADA